jgi:poly(3-hydroxybutyrate) depolymerase
MPAARDASQPRPEFADNRLHARRRPLRNNGEMNAQPHLHGWQTKPIWRLACGLLMCAGFGLAKAGTTVRLPPTLCDANALLADDFETQGSLPSMGSGGPAPGNITRGVVINDVVFLYYAYLPLAYTPTRSWPLVVGLHGSAGSPAAANLAAQQVRSRWQNVADAQGVIVMAPIATGSNGSWVPAQDYPIITAQIAELEAFYNIERTRRYLWGFSAGGHVAHDVALAGPVGLNADTFAGYGVSAGSLQQYACNPSRPGAPTCEALLAAAPRRLPVDIHIGTSDPLYPLFTSQDPPRFITAGWQPGVSLSYVEFDGAHTYTSTHAAEIWAFLCPYAVIP